MFCFPSTRIPASPARFVVRVVGLWLILFATQVSVVRPVEAIRLISTSIDRQFPDGWCPIESRDGQQTETLWATFTAQSSSVRMVVSVDNFSPGAFGEWMNNRIDNIAVLERSVYAANRGPVPNYGDCYFDDPDAPALLYDPASPLTTVYLEFFDTDPSGDPARAWSTGTWDPSTGFSGTAPRNTVNGTDTTGGSLVLGEENDGVVTLVTEREVTNLSVGVEYVVVGWWSANVEGGQLTIEVFDDNAVAAPSLPGAGRAIRSIYPNPANPRVHVQLRLERWESPPSLTILDALGRRVRTYDLSAMTPGDQVVTWDGRDNTGLPVASGVYFARLEVAGHTIDRAKMVLAK